MFLELRVLDRITVRQTFSMSICLAGTGVQPPISSPCRNPFASRVPWYADPGTHNLQVLAEYNFQFPFSLGEILLSGFFLRGK